MILSAYHLGQAKTGCNRGIYPHGARCTTCADTSLRGGKSGHFCRASGEATTAATVTQGRNSQSNRSRRAISGAYSTYKLHLGFTAVKFHDLVLQSHLPTGWHLSWKSRRVGRDDTSGAPRGVKREGAVSHAYRGDCLCTWMRRSTVDCAGSDVCGPRVTFVPRCCAVVWRSWAR